MFVMASGPTPRPGLSIPVCGNKRHTWLGRRNGVDLQASTHQPSVAQVDSPLIGLTGSEHSECSECSNAEASSHIEYQSEYQRTGGT